MQRKVTVNSQNAFGKSEKKPGLLKKEKFKKGTTQCTQKKLGLILTRVRTRVTRPNLGWVQCVLHIWI